jgi:hypothetical protein
VPQLYPRNNDVHLEAGHGLREPSSHNRGSWEGQPGQGVRAAGNGGREGQLGRVGSSQGFLATPKSAPSRAGKGEAPQAGCG